MRLIGHDAQQRAFLDAWESARMHHGWLLAGPRGVGKAAFAYEAACFALAGGGPQMEMDAEHPVRKLMDAGSHGDFRLLERLVDKDGKAASAINVDQVRALQPLFQSKPCLGAWRAVIVDSVDDLNTAAANALLKNLEEPPAQTIFFLVSHAPDRLLPTIRSRCRMLRFQPLASAEVARVVARAGEEVDPAELDAVTHLALGSPGRALRLAGLKVHQMMADLEAIQKAAPAQQTQLALKLAKSLAGKPQQPRFEAFVELVPEYMAGHVRKLQGPSLAVGLSLWEKAHQLARGAVPLSLDPQSTAFELACLVGNLPEAAPETLL